MTAALIPINVAARTRSIGEGGAWHELALSLRHDLQPLKQLQAPIPEIKAKLTRIGGRCASDGTLLAFDPFQPHRHICPTCGAVYSREEDTQWWAMGANLWSAERAVHAAALSLLAPEYGTAPIAASILQRFAEQYLRWPNVDNVLGPSRPFFSTYLESIWLLNICHALSLLELAPRNGSNANTMQTVSRLGGLVREKLIEPSYTLLLGFNEGLSNRQVWNETAILCAMQMLGKSSLFRERAESSSGILGLLQSGLLADGSWYEGENYHQFAHRGLWYAVQLFDANGIAISSALRERYREGFVAPFRGLLPDGTFPSRKDSQYRVSAHQWRFAEWCELGIAESRDMRLLALRKRLYENDLKRVDTGRSVSTADSERNNSASSLSRADCNWRALLRADDSFDAADSAAYESSELLERQGIAVIRRDGGNTYVALEGGSANAGSHGHPDRLSLTLQCGNKRFLDDPGTGSYVERKLHWYRSTLAHHAPLIDRKSQSTKGEYSTTELVAFEDRGGFGWVCKRARLSNKIVATRYVVIADGYLVDVLEWQSFDCVERELAISLCSGARVVGEVNWVSEAGSLATGLEDGFDFAENVEVHSGRSFELEALSLNESLTGETFESLRVWVFPDEESSLVRASVPAPPGYSGDIQRHWLRTNCAPNSRGRVVSCYAWATDVERRIASVSGGASNDGNLITVVSGNGTTASHFLVNERWRIDLKAANAISSIDLDELRVQQSSLLFDSDGVASERNASNTSGTSSVVNASASGSFIPPLANEESSASTNVIRLSDGARIAATAAKAQYVKTEQSWEEAGSPSARFEIWQANGQLVVEVAMQGDVVAPAAGSENHLDNENADTNATGVQFYVGDAAGTEWEHGWLTIPSTEPRYTVIKGSPVHLELKAEFFAEGADNSNRLGVERGERVRGWKLRIAVPAMDVCRGSGVVAIDVVVNERPAWRERRRGQLVLSGCFGGDVASFAYLRGDRHAFSRAVLVYLRAE